MNINKVILSSTDDEFLDFYPVVSKAWRKIGIEPVLFLINPKIETEDSSVISVDFSSEQIDSVFVSQNIRLLGTCLFPDDILILSDIDMMPLSKEYFHTNIKKYSDDTFINMRKNVTKNNMYPICYSVAQGNTWIEVFQADSLSSIRKKLTEWYLNEYIVNGKSWYFDQLKLFESLKSFKSSYPKRFIELDDKTTDFCRLNRTKLKRNTKKFYDENLNYTDFHMPRPYRKYKKIINKVYEKTYGDLNEDF